MTPIAPLATPPDAQATPLGPAHVAAGTMPAIPAAPETVETHAHESSDEPARSVEALQEQLDGLLAETRSELRFRVDEDTQRVVVSVIDGNGDVIMQVPDATALALARRLAHEGHLLDLQA